MKIDKEPIKDVLKMVINLLIQRNYERLFELDFEKQICIEEIMDAVKYIEKNITLPPDDELLNFDVFETEQKNKIIVEINLWINDAQSDYTLSCIILKLENKYYFSIDGIRIL